VEVPVRDNGTRILLIVIDLLIGVIVGLCAAFLTWKDGKTPYRASISGCAAFAAAVLLALAVEQALGALG
jgi:hypothetical protein